MIKDKVKNIGRYVLNDSFEIFKEKIISSEAFLSEIASPLKAISLEYETKEFDLTKFENHLKNIDIHIVIEGGESIGINCTDNLSPSMIYDEKNDYQLYEGEIKETITLQPGDFLLLYPGEAHITGGKVLEFQKVKKIIYKLPF